MWRSALISAIFEKGNRCQAGNYRRVSITSVACKALESLARKHFIEFMKRNNFFTKKTVWIHIWTIYNPSAFRGT
jgi:hypothetical protein